MKIILPALLLLSASASALTQAEVEQAVYDALTSAPLNFSGGQMNTVPWTYPSLSAPSLGEYLVSILGGTFNFSPPDEGTLLDNLVQIRSRVQGLGSVSNLLDSIRTDVNAIRSDAFAIRSDVTGQIKGDLAALSTDFSSYKSDWQVYISSINSELSQCSDILSRLRSDFNFEALSSSNEMASVLAALQSAITKLDSVDAYLNLTYSSVANIEYRLDDVGDYLYYIEQHTEDTAGACGGIFDWLRYEFYDILVDARADLIANLPTEYDVNVLNWPASFDVNLPNGWDSGLHGALQPLSFLGNISTNTSGFRSDFGDFASWFTNGFAVATTNFFASFTPTVEQNLFVQDQTNSLNSFVVSNDVESTEQVEDLQDEAQDYTSSWYDNLDFFTQNPYDGADSAFDNFEDSVEELVADVNPATTSDVIIMGSVDASPSRSSSSIQAQVAKLPRIEFNMEFLFSKWRRLATIKNLFKALWLIVGVFYRLILLWKFLDWFAKYDKS